MIDAVFIADLHLHPQDNALIKKFNIFCEWAKTNTKSVYILGDFFHVWAGDDFLDEWSIKIAKKLCALYENGIKVYFMPGNRDFLIGKKFVNLSKIQLLQDPTVIKLTNQRVMLSHGDRYCTKDWTHQLLRIFTRNKFFCFLFMLLPVVVRGRMVFKVRKNSQNNKKKQEKFDITLHSILGHMKRLQSKTIIHGHIHKPGDTSHSYKGELYKQYVVSDWDDNPVMVCYNDSVGIYLEHLRGCNDS